MAEHRYYVIRETKMGKPVAILFKEDFKSPFYEFIIKGFRYKRYKTQVYYP